MPLTAGDLVTDALRELGVLNAVDPPSGEDAALGLARLNGILDSLNAKGSGVYAEAFSSFVLTPSLNPHTIGPTGTWVVAQRPEAILDAALVLPGAPAVYQPIAIHDVTWFEALSVPALPSIYPTDLYYEKAWPNGTLRFWPVGTTAYSVRLLLRVVLAALAWGDTFTLPPGYQEFLMFRLAVNLATPMRTGVSADTKQQAIAAEAVVFGNNDRPRRISTRDSGMPSGGARTTWNYLTRT